MKCDCKNVTLPCGQEIFVREWLPEGEVRKGVLFLHGVESHSEWFSDVAAVLASGGVAAVAFDRPGWGRSAGMRGHLLSYADAVKAVTEMATIIRERFGSCHLAGLSWGGMLALYTALRRAPLFDGVTLIAPGIFSREDLSFVDKARVGFGILSGNFEKTVSLAINVNNFTNKPDKQSYIEQDVVRTREVSAQFCLETLKMRKFIVEHCSRRPLPFTQLLLAGDDRIIENNPTRALLEKTGAKIVDFPGRAHSLVFEDAEGVAHAIFDALEVIVDNMAKNFSTVAVMGAGAVGSAVGALLALGGHNVTLVARKEHADAVNENGLRLKVGAGQRIIKDRLCAVTYASEINAPVDIVVLTVKSFDTEKALSDMHLLIGENTEILSLQNGLLNESKIRDAYPDNKVYSGSICAYLDFSEAGEICWADDRGGIVIALPGDKHDSLVEQLCACGMEIDFVRGRFSSEKVKWSKLLLNLQFNAINAVTGMTTADILAHSEYGMLAVEALKEGVRVMAAKGIKPVDLPGYPVCALSRLARLPASLVRRILAFRLRAERSGASSMRQDFLKKRVATEIDEINGVVVIAAKEFGIKTPANERLCQMVRDAIAPLEI